MTRQLLIEIGCEDLPARYVLPLAEALAAGVEAGLTEADIAHGEARHFATPRRIAVIVDAVAEAQPDRQMVRKGPALKAAFKDGEATPAAIGFARSCGVGIDALEQQDGKLVFHGTRQGQPTAQRVPELFAETLKRMDALVPKRMRWGASDETFVRPVQWLVALYGDQPIALEHFGLSAGRQTRGHRFHAPQAIELKSPVDYEPALRQAKVWVDFDSRRQTIQEGIEAAARELGGRARVTPELLDEVTALVEWPVVIVGRLEARFLALPPEAVVATVETHQRYFTVFSDTASVEHQVRAEAGYLMPAFITVANIESSQPEQIVAGNERVVRPRLADALFFWEQDRKQPLAAYGAKLTSMTYHKALGSMAERVNRLAGLARQIAESLGEDADSAERAATLCKCDLVTHMVGEFPELQGVIGGYYAQADGEDAAVAQAVRQHYQPTRQGATIPSGAIGRVLALADKLDALAGIFAIGQKPTASKDPFALRRAALGALRICIEGELDIDLRQLLIAALELQPAGERGAATLDPLWAFVLERLRGLALEQGFSVEQFEAVSACEVTQPLDFVRRLEALRSFADSTAAAGLAAADKRARNLLKRSGTATGEWATGGLVTGKLEHPAEIALAEAVDAAESALRPLRREARYAAMFERLADLKPPVDAFFDEVMVMAEDATTRNNRLALLSRLDALCREVADLSRLPG